VVQVQLKLKLRPAQERQLDRWLWHLTGVYNWAIRKIELDAAHGIYHSRYDLESKLKGHGKRLGIPQVSVADTARTAHNAWVRCFKRLAGRPRLKGRRNKLNSIPHHHGREFQVANGKVRLPGLGRVGFHRQEIPEGQIKCARLIKRSSGWHLCLTVGAEPKPIIAVADGQIGIDPGFSSLLVTSAGEKIEHPRELERGASRLAQAQRGHKGRLTARLLERQVNRRRNRNHQLSRRLVSENALIAFSADNHRGIAHRFGKSVTSSSHAALRRMLAYKSSSCGRRYVEVSSRNSTRTCSACGQLSGPSGLASLSVRQWACDCGVTHDRDINAAVNVLIAARGMRVERVGDDSSGIAKHDATRRSSTAREGLTL